jgi:hypothetical protein
VSAARRTCVVPDLGEALTAALMSTEEMFVAVGMAVKFGGLVTPLPPPLDGRTALGAAVRVAWAVAPTQSGPGRVLPRLLAPDGRTRHVALRFVELDPADLEVLGAAARAVGRCVLPGAGVDELTAVLEQHAAGRDTTVGALVFQLARLHGLLDLAWTDDVALLYSRICAAGPADVVLTSAEEAAYQRTAGRFDGMWTPGSGAIRFTD